jgi:hypothetical protein
MASDRFKLSFTPTLYLAGRRESPEDHRPTLHLCAEEPAMQRETRRFPLKAILLAAFGALQIADVITTNRVLANGGWEANPLGVWAMAHLGNYWAIPKLALMAVCGAVMIRWKPRHVAPLVALMGVVVANNAVWAYMPG